MLGLGCVRFEPSKTCSDNYKRLSLALLRGAERTFTLIDVSLEPAGASVLKIPPAFQCIDKAVESIICCWAFGFGILSLVCKHTSTSPKSEMSMSYSAGCSRGQGVRGSEM